MCYANDETYETGENFFPNCKTECICVDGVIGCRKAQDPAHCEGETIMAMAAHTKPIDMVEVRPANEDKNIAGKSDISLGWISGQGEFWKGQILDLTKYWIMK